MVECLLEIRTIKVCRDVPHLYGKGLFLFSDAIWMMRAETDQNCQQFNGHS
jgi:hypothetical protein